MHPHLLECYDLCDDHNIRNLTQRCIQLYEPLTEAFLVSDYHTDPKKSSKILGCLLSANYTNRCRRDFMSKIAKQFVDVDREVVCDTLSCIINTPVLAARTDLYELLFLWWDIDRVDKYRSMTLLNYMVSEREEGPIVELRKRGASVDVENSQYNNVATLALFSIQSPSHKVKRLQRHFMSPSTVFEYQKFFNVVDAFSFPNIQYINETLQSYTYPDGTFHWDCNLRTISNRSLLSMIPTVDILKLFLHNHFRVTLMDLVHGVRFMHEEVVLYLICHMDFNVIDVAMIAESCPDAILQMKIYEQRKKKEKEICGILSESMKRVPLDVCKMVVEYV